MPYYEGQEQQKQEPTVSDWKVRELGVLASHEAGQNKIEVMHIESTNTITNETKEKVRIAIKWYSKKYNNWAVQKGGKQMITVMPNSLPLLAEALNKAVKALSGEPVSKIEESTEPTIVKPKEEVPSFLL